jgi:hypothetical protein
MHANATAIEMPKRASPQLNFAETWHVMIWGGFGTGNGSANAAVADKASAMMTVAGSMVPSFLPRSPSDRAAARCDRAGLQDHQSTS